jgi:CheY-like chemotaxis protein
VKKILFVDDNEHLHDLMKRLLAFMGYESITAAGAKEGLKKAVSEAPDLILLDIGLPDMDGRDVARFLRSDPATKNILILAFTGTFDASLGESCLQAGCDDYVEKPVSYEVLREKIQTLLDMRRRH